MDQQTPLTPAEQKKTEKVVKEFFDKLELSVSPTVTSTEDGMEVQLETDESGIIIGYHGETLDSLQLLLSLVIAKHIGRFVRVMIDVGDYRKNRTEYLVNLAEQMKQRVLRDNHEQTITQLKSWERRIIHMILKDDEEVITESEGTGRDRILVIRPR